MPLVSSLFLHHPKNIRKPIVTYTSRHHSMFLSISMPGKHLEYFKTAFLIRNSLTCYSFTPSQIETDQLFQIAVINPSRPIHTSLWSLKRLYEDLKGLHKTFYLRPGSGREVLNYIHSERYQQQPFSLNRRYWDSPHAKSLV